MLSFILIQNRQFVPLRTTALLSIHRKMLTPEIQGQDPSREMVRSLQRRGKDQAQGRSPPPRRPAGPEIPIQLCRVPQQQDCLPTIRRPLLLRLRRHQR